MFLPLSKQLVCQPRGPVSCPGSSYHSRWAFTDRQHRRDAGGNSLAGQVVDKSTKMFRYCFSVSPGEALQSAMDSPSLPAQVGFTLQPPQPHALLMSERAVQSVVATLPGLLLCASFVAGFASGRWMVASKMMQPLQ